MEIVCSQCSHVMPHAQAAGSLVGEALSLYKKHLELYLSAQNLAIQTLSAKELTIKRGLINSCSEMMTNFIIGLINNLEVQCPKCHKFTQWTVQKDHFGIEIATTTPSVKETSV
ncbi:MAG: hypothetical protein WC747_04220 [Candidatus Babeliales bacterium]